ncbi:MAG: hypothetical protein AMDU4_FER2C00278G0001 [Ferroplasma sp. Type II]|nr:MAG: hypothetical protein AMDU4_FER2C00278G0001 [Ferroplasma sp. Type II]
MPDTDFIYSMAHFILSNSISGSTSVLPGLVLSPPISMISGFMSIILSIISLPSILDPLKKESGVALSIPMTSDLLFSIFFSTFLEIISSYPSKRWFLA